MRASEDVPGFDLEAIISKMVADWQNGNLSDVTNAFRSLPSLYAAYVALRVKDVLVPDDYTTAWRFVDFLKRSL